MRYDNWHDIPHDKAVTITAVIHMTEPNKGWWDVSFVGEKWWEKKYIQKQKQDGQ